jgi:hypothetical protein
VMLFDIDSSTLDDLVGQLYQEPASTFVSSRNSVVKTLKAAKRVDDAKVIAQLPKPTAAATALNNVCRARPDLVDAIIEAGESLASAQQALLLGSGDAQSMHTASEARRATIRNLVTALDSLLDPKESRKPDEWARTLEAASVDPSLQVALRAGRFSKLTTGGIGFDGSIITDGPLPTTEPNPRPESQTMQTSQSIPPTGTERPTNNEAAEAADNADAAEKTLAAEEALAAEQALAAERRAAAYATAFADAEQHLTHATNELDTAQSQRLTIAVRLDELEQQVVDAHQAVTAAQIALEQAVYALSQLQTSHEQLSAELASYDTQLLAARSTHQAAVVRLNDLIASQNTIC